MKEINPDLRNYFVTSQFASMKSSDNKHSVAVKTFKETTNHEVRLCSARIVATIRENRMACLLARYKVSAGITDNTTIPIVLAGSDYNQRSRQIWTLGKGAWKKNLSWYTDETLPCRLKLLKII